MKPTSVKTKLKCLPVTFSNIEFSDEASTHGNSEDTSDFVILKLLIGWQPSQKYAGGRLEAGQEVTWTY
jgi:hypothetical protein